MAVRPRTFAASRNAEKAYGAQLRKVARHISDIVKGFPVGDLDELPAMIQALQHYSLALRPWARSVAWRMLMDVAKRDEATWASVAREMSSGLRKEIREAFTSAVMQQKLSDSVELITSLPIEAGERVHKLTLEGITSAGRYKEIADAILATGAVSASRATLIARTEVARTASLLTQARAEYIGSEGYIWRTVKDLDVRKSHKEMEGVFVRWDTPPTLSDGTVTHAGQIYNCRCFSEPVIPEF